MEKSQRDSNIIDLDDPPVPGYRILVLLACLLALMLVFTPFMLSTTTPGSDTTVTEQTRPFQANNPECRPSLEVPKVLRPLSNVALPSFTRVCDWFSGPGS